MTDILNWVKAHLLIVLFVAIIVVSIPTGVFFGNGSDAAVREPLVKRVRATETSLKKVESTNVTIQSLHPSVKSFDRKMVITEDILNEYRDIRESIKLDADGILKAAEEINRTDHYDELVRGLLPAPRAAEAQSLPYQINPAYLSAHEDLLVELKAGGPISDEVLGMTLQDFEGTYIRTQLNQEVGEALEEEDEKQLQEAMTARRMLEYRQHAEGISVYADILIFNLESWDNARGAPTPSMWFNWQHAYWVNQDIVRAINLANSLGNGRVTALNAISGQPGSVVKRIMNIEMLPMFNVRVKAKKAGFTGGFEDEEVFYGGMDGMAFDDGGGGPGGKGGGKSYQESEYGEGEGGGEGGRASAEPTEVSNDDATQAFEDDFAASLSGRSSNPLYDVRKVTLTAVVDSNRLPALINSIQQTNLMTVTGIQLQKVNILNDLALGYAYGNEPVVKVILDIETLWLRDWLTALMPDDVKETLDILPLDEDESEDEDGG